jgi:hypothetical protein
MRRIVRDPEKSPPTHFIGLEFPEPFGSESIKRLPPCHFEIEAIQKAIVENTIVFKELCGESPTLRKRLFIDEGAPLPDNCVLNHEFPRGSGERRGEHGKARARTRTRTRTRTRNKELRIYTESQECDTRSRSLRGYSVARDVDTTALLRPQTDKPRTRAVDRALEYIPYIPFQRRKMLTLKWYRRFSQMFHRCENTGRFGGVHETRETQ